MLRKFLPRCRARCAVRWAQADLAPSLAHNKITSTFLMYTHALHIHNIAPSHTHVVSNARMRLSLAALLQRAALLTSHGACNPCPDPAIANSFSGMLLWHLLCHQPLFVPPAAMMRAPLAPHLGVGAGCCRAVPARQVAGGELVLWA